MADTPHAAVELQITSLRLALSMLDNSDLGRNVKDLERVSASVTDTVNAVRYVLSKLQATAEQQQQIDNLVSQLLGRLAHSSGQDGSVRLGEF